MPQKGASLVFSAEAKPAPMVVVNLKYRHAHSSLAAHSPGREYKPYTQVTVAQGGKAEVLREGQITGDGNSGKEEIIFTWKRSGSIRGGL